MVLTFLPLRPPLDCRCCHMPLQYCGTYGPQAMSAWAQRAAEWAGTGRITYFAFNNDAVSERSETPSAILDCRYLAAVLGKRGTFVP